MNFGSVGLLELFPFIIISALPVLLLLWFIKTLTAVAVSLRQIADRLATLERTLRDTASTQRFS